MLHINFALSNPWSRRFSCVYNTFIPLTENKGIEYGVYKDASIIRVSFGITVGKRDHAGFDFSIGMFGYSFDFVFYDNRHYEED